MTHAAFILALRAGRIKAGVDPKAAARFVAARMLLPWVLLALAGSAVALALSGQLLFGALALIAAIVTRRLVAASSAGYVLQRAIADPRFFAQVLAAGVLQIDQNSKPVMSEGSYT